MAKLEMAAIRRMHRTWFRQSLAQVAVVLLGVTPLLASGPKIDAEVRRPVATLQSTELWDGLEYSTKFDLRLTNRSDKPVNLPTPRIWDARLIGIDASGTELKRPFDTWKPLLIGDVLIPTSWLTDGVHKFERCTSVRPGQAVDIQDVAGLIIVMRNRVEEIGTQPTLRLGLTLLCVGDDAKLVWNGATTDEFTIRLPAEPKRP